MSEEVKHTATANKVGTAGAPAAEVPPSAPIQGEAWKIDDYTFYLDKVELGGREVTPEQPFEEFIDVEGFQGEAIASGRIHIVSCYNGLKYSATLRKKRYEQQKQATSGERPEYRIRTSFAEDDKVNHGYRPNPDPSKEFPVSIASICDLLGQRIPLGDDSEPTKEHGLVVIAGSTSSGKSLVANGLIYNYLEAVIKRREAKTESVKRRPHLVTVEDPIDTWYVKNGEESKKYLLAQEMGVDYTPRALGKGKDVLTLRRAFRDALRQTPTVFYVSEVREPMDWRQVMDFAGTGHLVVTTTHAGSLVEAMERILRAMQATSSAERGQFAQRILAVVHQRRVNVGRAAAFIPSLWHRTPAGVAALVSDGLASVLPNFLEMDRSEGAGVSSFGRRWFARQLLEKASVQQKVKQEFERRAAQMDLLGA